MILSFFYSCNTLGYEFKGYNDDDRYTLNSIMENDFAFATTID